MMERYDAVIQKGWGAHGIAHVLVTRRHSDGSADIGFFLVDIWCLGVKDAFADQDVPASELAAYIKERMPEGGSERIHPACARKLIEGAIAYAERSGIAPHREYRKARRVLSGIDASRCPMEFTFGHEGRPRFVCGPQDSEERVTKVLALLTARYGEDGFDFVDITEDAEDDTLFLRDELMEWLDAQPEDVPRFFRLSGMVTALHICPGLVQPARLLEVVGQRLGGTWPDEDELRNFAELLTEYWSYVAGLVHDTLAPEAHPGDQAIDIWEADFSDDLANPEMSEESERSKLSYLAAMIEWSGGFLETTRLWPEAWGDALQRPELAEHWEIVRWWAEFLGTDNKDRIADAAEANPPRTIAAAVTALGRALRPPPPAAG